MAVPPSDSRNPSRKHVCDTWDKENYFRFASATMKNVTLTIFLVSQPQTIKSRRENTPATREAALEHHFRYCTRHKTFKPTWASFNIVWQ